MLDLDPANILEIVVRTSVVYFFLLVILRLSGKHELGQLRIFDFVVVLTISNAVQNAMVGSDTSLSGGLIAAAVLVVLDWAVSRFTARSGWLEPVLTGNPTLLINDGRVIDGNLRHEQVTVDELLMALREHGYESPSDVKMAVLEVDGTISVVAQGTPVSRTRHRVRGRKPVG